MRKGAGLTQRDLAKKLNREHSFVSRVEGGERRVDLIEFYALCDACGADAVPAATRLLRQFGKLSGDAAKR